MRHKLWNVFLAVLVVLILQAGILGIARAQTGAAAAKPALLVYSSAIGTDNPELRAGKALEIPVVRRAVVLAALVHRQRGLCVAGMHGKTTTAALLAFALENLQVRPSYAIGGLVPQFPRHARFNPTANLYFAVEADESDGTLREFHPEGAIMLNVDEEHLDHYGNIEAVCREFETFAAQTRGPLVFCAEDGRLAQLCAQHPRAFSYGFAPSAQYRIETRQNGKLSGARCAVGHGGYHADRAQAKTRASAEAPAGWAITKGFAAVPPPRLSAGSADAPAPAWICRQRNRQCTGSISRRRPPPGRIVPRWSLLRDR